MALLVSTHATLSFVADQAEKYGYCPIVTFDQPLWWKSLQIVMSENEDSPLRSIVLRLGGFHTQMSVLGSIGAIMNGSELQEILVLIHAKNTVPHMLNGKTVYWAVRGRLIVDAALTALLLAKAYDLPLSLTEENIENEEILIEQSMPEKLRYAKYLLQKLQHEDCKKTQLDKYNLTKIHNKIDDEKKNRKLTSGKLVWAAAVFLKKQFSNKNVNSTP